MGKRKRVAMVLAAGLGTRLRPLTFEIPKPAIPVLGRPLITYTLEFLSRFNVREVVINLHRIPGAVRSKVLEWGKFPGRVSFVIEPEILGTGGGIRNALPHFSGAEEVIVANSDTIVDFDMEKALAHHRKRKNLATLVLFPLREKRYTPVYTDGKNSLLSIGAPSQGEGPFFFTGVSILRREFIERIPPGKRCLIRDGILPLVREGKGAGGFVTEGNFMEFGTPSDYLENTLLLLEKASPPLPGLESARVIP
ncbi:MAG: NDP-sugar synthase, partial [Deltaproteobacteria bacterium]